MFGQNITSETKTNNTKKMNTLNSVSSKKKTHSRKDGEVRWKWRNAPLPRGIVWLDE